MASGQEGLRNNHCQPHTFEWKTSLYHSSDQYEPKRSPFFHFCGYYCQFYCYKKSHTNRDIEIILKGYAAPYHKNFSCYYSARIFNDQGVEKFKTEGRLLSLEDTEPVIFKDINSNDVRNASCILFFSWCEDIKKNLSNPVLTSEMESNKFLEILSKDLSSFYENKTDPDCVLKVDETEFPVHRSVLSSRSTVFAAMFHHDTSERQSGEVNILDVDAGALGDVLYYIYAGKVRGLSPETAVSMYEVSNKYALIDLRVECLNFLMNNLTMENLCDAALLAHTHAETDLENNVLQFIEERLEELMQNDNWKKFSDTHLKLANYLLSSAFMGTKTKLMKMSSNP